MKVLFLSRLYLPHIGGVELHIQNLVQAFPSDIQVTLVTEQHDASLPLQEKMGRVNVFRIPLPHQKTNRLAIWWWWLRHLSLIYSSDVIHIHDVFFWLLPFKCIFFWKKMYMTFHGYEGINNPKRKQKIWHQVAEMLTEGNICIGGFHQKWFGVIPTITSFGAVKENKKHLINEEIAKKKFSPKAKIKILFVGRLAADTGILVYLEAVRILQTRYKVSLDVYGDGPQRAIAEETIKSDKLPVIMHGFVPANKIEWQEYDVAFVSRYLSILESLIAGLPVIGQYNVAIKKDYLCLTPFVNWIAVGQTAGEIVTGFEQIFDAETTQKIEAAHTWASQQSWKKLAEEYQHLWQN